MCVCERERERERERVYIYLHTHTQFVASLQGGAGDKGIPKAYVDVLRVLTDAAPYHEFGEMNEVLLQELGAGAEELFATFDKVPIAAASLAQVHRATLKDGMHVAVKILYPSLRKEMASDFAMFRRLGGQIKPGGYDMLWLVEDFETAIRSELGVCVCVCVFVCVCVCMNTFSDFETAIRSELDCQHEARNCEKAGELLLGRRGVKLPKVVWNLTRKDVLVMEYVPGLMRLTEPEVLVANGLKLPQCGQIVSDTLTELGSHFSKVPKPCTLNPVP
jgi:predicted unusual protein kinase regulating ubiquinone biosynthesis (AarF/ABC1/UbiB family)